jgi:hypothetical protein
LQLTAPLSGSGWLAALACRSFCCVPQLKRKSLARRTTGQLTMKRPLSVIINEMAFTVLRRPEWT